MYPKTALILLMTICVQQSCQNFSLLDNPGYREDSEQWNNLFNKGPYSSLNGYNDHQRNEDLEFQNRNLFASQGEYPYDKGPIASKEDYDFIIIGAGSAGSVIANRLSENPEWRILLLEAGQPESMMTDIPILAPFLQVSDYIYPYLMERQDNVCLGMTDQQCAWPRGKALGGTSVINYMIYTRGNRIDFDRWAAQGNPGWSWDEVVPYYKKSERAKISYADPEYHNSTGTLNVEDVRARTPLADAFIQAGLETGRQFLDYNGRSQFGFSYLQANTRSGRRCSASKAFLHPARNRKNLRILPRSRVLQILINPLTKVAYGVNYVRERRSYIATARKEVILSAGTFHSPQLLMLSGVGPEDHLRELSIPLIQNLPVGQYMQDHLCVIGLTFLVNQTGVGFTFDRMVRLDNILNYITNGQGSLTAPGGVVALGYIKTKLSEETEDYPDVEFIFCGGSINSDRGTGLKTAFRVRQDIYDEVYRPIEEMDTWTILPMLLHPKSRGYLRLKSRNPFDWPLLYGNSFTDPEGHDLETMVQAVREVIKLSQTKAFRKYGSKLHDIPLPGCKHLPFNSDDYWRCFIRHFPPSLHHQIGTCKMGPRTDPEAIVDSELKIYGIQRLRVADSSIIPFPLSAHTNAPSIMIGEKAADMIKKTWGIPVVKQFRYK